MEGIVLPYQATVPHSSLVSLVTFLRGSGETAFQRKSSSLARSAAAPMGATVRNAGERGRATNMYEAAPLCILGLILASKRRDASDDIAAGK